MSWVDNCCQSKPYLAVRVSFLELACCYLGILTFVLALVLCNSCTVELYEIMSRCKAQPAHKSLWTWGFICPGTMGLLLGNTLTLLVMTWELYSVILSGLLIAGISFNVDFCRHYVNTLVI